jgi:hypothetical protein
MKNITKLFAIAIVVIGSASTSFAQVTATASTSATIITPIAITKTVDMNFGNVAVSPTIAGTVVLVPAGTRSKTGGVTLPVTAGTVTAAKFNVTGQTGATYSITLPPADITLSNGTQTMTVGTFTSTPVATGTLTGGTEEISVGATLNVAAGQASGLYTNASDLFVTVNYN